MDTWNFQKNEDGSSVGWNDPALQAFRVGRIKNLAREIIQNSTDHQADPDRPVRIVFELADYPRSEIPGMTSLAAAIKGCEKVMSTENENSKIEIKYAVRASNASDIRVLTISDYGASGMADTFYTYLRTSGQGSDGNNSDRGGSHGLGKSAPIVLSGLRSIIVSSIWKDKNGAYDESVQGRTTLMSRKIANSTETYNNVGYWGNGFNPISSNGHKYPWINRAPGSIGTSIHVIGFQPPTSAKWKIELIAFAIAAYFPAFHRGNLILEIKDKGESEFTIDQDNIEQFFEKDWPKLLEKQEDQVLLANGKHYFQLLKSSDDQIIEEEFEIQNLGKCRLRLRVSETDELPKKICVLRKGICITDSLSTFYKQVPSSLMDFVGVFECLNKDGAKMIRRMEPPQHNDLNEEQLPTSEQEKGKKILKDLGSMLKTIVKKHATSDDDDDEIQIDALSEFLQDEGEVGKEDLETDPNGNWGLPSPKPLPKPKRKPTLSPEGEEEQTGPDRVGPSSGAGRDPVPGPGPVSGTASTSKTVDKTIKLSELRVVRSSVKVLKILFNSQKTQNNCELKLLEMGSENHEMIGITSSDTGNCVEGKIFLDVKGDTRVELNVEIERPLVGAAGLILSHKSSFEEAES